MNRRGRTDTKTDLWKPSNLERLAAIFSRIQLAHTQTFQRQLDEAIIRLPFWRSHVDFKNH